jgi:hypothetical protein
MKRILWLWALVSCGLLCFIGYSLLKNAKAAEPQPQASKATVEGLVRDIACPIQNLQATATHYNAKCLQECVKSGSPLVILSKDGELYLPISDKMPDTDQRQVLVPFVGKYVQASGTIFERKGTHAIVITGLMKSRINI